MHDAVTAPLVRVALRGGSGTLVLYGQTGSGKTRTLGRLQALIAAQLFESGALAVEVR